MFERKAADKKAVELIRIDRIAPNPSQPRRRFCEEGILRLADSIRRHGLLQPLCVRRVKGTPEYELISGERRLRACSLIGMTKAPCIVMEGVNSLESAQLAVVENTHRENLDFFEQAQAMEALLKNSKMSRSELCEALCVSQSALSNKLRLLKLTSPQRAAILNASLSERHARAVLRIASNADRTFIISKIVEFELSVRESEKLVDEYLKSPEETVNRLKNPPAPKENKKRVRKFFVKDVRIFINSVDKAVRMIKESGIDVSADKRDEDDHIEYLIRVPKITA